MKNKHIRLAIISLIAISALTFGDTIAKTFNEVIEIASNNTLQTKIDEINIELLEEAKADADKDATMYTYVGDNKAEIMRVYNLNTVQPLIALNELNYEKLTKKMNEDQLAIDIELAICSLKLAEEELMNARLNLAYFELDYQAAKLKRELGLITQIELTEKENALEDQRLDIMNLENVVFTDQMELKRLMGIDYSEEVLVDYQMEIKPQYDIDLQKNLTDYISNQFAVTKAKNTLEIKENLFDLVKENFAENVKEYKQAEYDYLVAKNDYESIVETTESEIYTLYSSLQTKYESYVIALEYQELYAKRLEEETKKLELGLVSEIDLAYAKMNLRDKDLAVKKAMCTFNSAHLQFSKIIKTYSID
ncbi:MULTISPECIES: TolC family protein [unclassified Fusibacter]|uniref:TolC family protein n=1 Tax=unclassified Fusibacter TaxID=2624464 RepID=UPI0013E998C5|nr:MULTISPECIES: TolC family protein [unclassified Fusibacter]MCK8061244.1 TolC family protein [Fusibacter sp. A2]NPE23412.1 TolC family protein [Fusibacter sp. A1]